MLARSPYMVLGEKLSPHRDEYADDPALWAREVLGVHLWSRQAEILESVRDNTATAVRSGHGIGKTLTAAVATLWFLDCFEDSRVVTTATKWSQVRLLLWHEIGKLHGIARQRAEASMRQIFGAVPLQTELRLPSGRYAIGLQAKPENSEAFAGHHAPNILLIFDEASGVHQSIYEVGEGYMTTEGARKLLIGNPTRTSGEFFDAFHSKRAEYHTIHVSAEESPAITGEWVPDAARRALTSSDWVEGRRKAWGAESPMFQIRVLGNFSAMSEDTVIGLGLVEDAQERELPPAADDKVVIGCDVARFGDDETVIARRHGDQVRILESYYGQPTTHTAGRVAHWAEQEAAPELVDLIIDDAGVGGGVTDQLRADGRWRVTAFNGANKARRPKFPNRRSELWFEAAAQMTDIDLDGDEQLAADLVAPKYSFNLKLQRVVEKKEETKKRLGRSPDRGDAVLLTLARPGEGEMLTTGDLRLPSTKPVARSPEDRLSPGVRRIAGRR